MTWLIPFKYRSLPFKPAFRFSGLMTGIIRSVQKYDRALNTVYARKATPSLPFYVLRTVPPTAAVKPEFG